MFVKTEKAGIVLKYVNETDTYLDVVYASVTAPEIVYVEIKVDDRVVDGVWVGNGESHSWWSNASGKFLPPHGLPSKSVLTITSTGPCAFRIDWP